jgi:hypothetical protein
MTMYDLYSSSRTPPSSPEPITVRSSWARAGHVGRLDAQKVSEVGRTPWSAADAHVGLLLALVDA